jgi:dienelactone hydrolase
LRDTESVKPICIAALLNCAALFSQTLEVTPGRALLDETIVIRALGLQPNERIAIRSELTDGAGVRWSAQAEFVADAQGIADVSRQATVAGSYKGVSAMGLIWSMMPAAKNVSAYQPPPNLGPQTVEFQLMRKGQKIAGAQFVQASVGEGVRRIPVREGDLRGVLFVPAGGERHPAVVVVGGSNGGVPSRPAAWLASRGFVALALAYFHYDDLPPMLEAIPLEYFQRGMAWLMNRPEVSGNRLAVMGTSRGGELALQLGSMFPAIGAVVAYVPANVRYAACCGNTRVPYAWTWGGRPLPYLLPRFARSRGAAPEAAIEVEQTRGPVLMISGEDDRLWRSWEMADAVAARLKRSKFTYSFANLKYPHAGHSAGRPDIRPTWQGAARHPISGRMEDLGGSAAGDAESSIDSIPKVLEFLRKSL